MTGFVYFIQAGDENGAIKIGFTSGSVQRRIQNHQVGCPDQLRLLGSVIGDDLLEARFHRVFRKYRLKGEWFRPHSRLLSFIKRSGAVVNHPLLDEQPPAEFAPLRKMEWYIDRKWSRRKQFAAAVGIGDSYLSQIVGGSRPLLQLPFTLVAKLAFHSGMPLAELAEAAVLEDQSNRMAA